MDLTSRTEKKKFLSKTISRRRKANHPLATYENYMVDKALMKISCFADVVGQDWLA